MITCIVINTHYHLLYGSTENEKNTIVNNERLQFNEIEEYPNENESNIQESSFKQRENSNKKYYE
jgi:hypothetical protein